MTKKLVTIIISRECDHGYNHYHYYYLERK